MSILSSPSSPQPFATGLESRARPLRAAITAATRIAEPEALALLLALARLPPDTARSAQVLAERLAGTLRDRKADAGRAGIVQGLLQEYALSSQEGVALMCLAEALLRIPDAATRDALIRDKIAHGDWRQHLGKSPSLFVNAATWVLLLTGKLVATHSESGLSSALARLIGRGGEPLIRMSVERAMRMMGEQFVTGETIADALAHARTREAQGFRYSYDMLGEAALTAADAARYLRDYQEAIDAIGRACAGRGVQQGPGISIKLSALHPRYGRAQYDRVMRELYPTLHALAVQARRHDIGLNIDAEESDRLELSLDLLERLCFAPELAGWDGIGFVIQAYQKRCGQVVDCVVDLARRSGHRLMVRLVKGAYWDSEIKRAQVDGQSGYPVYTRKAHTDVSYLACARKLLDAPDAVYPQFATHNAHTVAAIHEMAGPAGYAPGQYEFQCLHGMGEPLYEQVVGHPSQGGLGRPCRIYAPVGTHETLLAYLVRRLLENGANTSFVNRIADPTIPLAVLVEDPVAAVDRLADAEGHAGSPHPAIPLPAALYGSLRANALGLDLADDRTLATLAGSMQAAHARQASAGPLTACAPVASPAPVAVRNPACRSDVVGHVQESSAEDVDAAVAAAAGHAVAWAATHPAERADALDRAAAALEADMPELLGLLAREAGKIASNAVAEVREAVDFLRFYAAQVRRDFRVDAHRPLGPVVCISPWNFPLAIFVGQVAAALAAGNTVLAKPAEQTPLVAAHALRRLWQAGIPRAALQLLPGDGATVGARLIADARIQGVLFTGSTEVARLLQKTLAGRLTADGRTVPLIAETGGQNAMIVDSSALAEQVVADVLASAFDSAGQRCSALRLLCVQEDAADRILRMLRGAMAELRLGDPAVLSTDVGPVIDAEARDGIERHIAAMAARGCTVFRAAAGQDAAAAGTFVVPTLIELDHAGELQREVFGPVLHVVRWRREDIGALLDQIAATGYGLTLGLHTRIDETIARVLAAAHAGNRYVNRNMVGAVVGVQPFGGEGLSGTGPKAGGPLYLYRLLASRPEDTQARALALMPPHDRVAGAAAIDPPPPARPALASLQRWLTAEGLASVAALCTRFAGQSRSGAALELQGATGERNVYTLAARTRVLCLADDPADRLTQLAAVLAVGSRALWSAAAPALRARLPADVQARIDQAAEARLLEEDFDAVLHHGDAPALLDWTRRLAERPGAIVGVVACRPGERDLPLERLLVERSTSVNTAATGGNASLMSIG
ncbi:trifunctional transcriptional regulator/proline dehydrogenase/L-glutamate gamma-semialdehyde dehydrogenase [Xylophilus ampelinus]|uniref:Bifunctional protein PutA n=1 Tax=Xylophilus ampelinus TaxID=54067 RepID=A0A318SVA0_9BURK|nr:trifunctional transcriptional regulator/proline dehydrogenase/L-glutamate gamma-semialdehyde dehydrogenase [Xylophilus ampelinus]MCS4509803.1 trifunctional transcriptional regulator/proline dehydrogenase/L-glutamate gamma-semialdehyde dehydrogenase [Xylophilus ampelinus]PYE78667.1 L-proline dehydrogenase /delta-1-pyrroline-5-carboxylate dehydrogenase [Xylophilus ampelinus]